jgi:SAM-dependent methyltransferase
MDPSHKVNEEQVATWNGVSGQSWIAAQELLDGMFRPFQDLLVEAVPAGSRVLDVGCGTGATTLALAARAGHAVGVDLSAPMLEVARTRAEREGSAATFVCADAQTHAFAPASFDRVVSRFGVMFFDEPVMAFANLRRAAAPGGLARLITWRSPADNPFMTTGERAAAPFFPGQPARVPDAPGMYAFADAERVRRILDGAGWREVALRAIDVACAFPADALDRFATRLGAIARLLRETDDATRARVIPVVRAAFEPYVHGSEVRYTAACWQIEARA